MPLPALPCYPCPHHSACCAYGATLSDAEAAAITAAHGAERIYRTRWGEWRTRVSRRRCVFLVDNACTIYGKPYYPAVCRGFPFVDAETGGPYQFDRTICPEFVARPELLQINPYRKASGKRQSGSGERQAASGKREAVRSAAVPLTVDQPALSEAKGWPLTPSAWASK